MKLLRSLVVSFAMLGDIPISAASTTVTIPWIGYGDDSGFDEMVATVVGTSSDQTTYNINCPSNAPTTALCYGADGPPITLVSGPSTYDFIFSGGLLYYRTACVLTGAPWPTTGTCTISYTASILDSTTVEVETITVPNGDIHNLPDYSIFTAALTVVETSTTVASAAATVTTSGVTLSLSSSSTAKNESALSLSPTTTASGPTSVSGTASGAVRSSSSPNGAQITMAPLILVAGAMAGAAAVM